MKLYLAVVALILTGCSTATLPPAAPAPPPGFSAVIFPKTVTDFKLLAVQRFPNPVDGTMLRYGTADRLIADVYLYPVSPRYRDCLDGCADSAASHESALFVEVVPQLVQRGYHLAAHVTEERILTPPIGAPWRAGRYVELAITDRQGEGQSEFYVFYFPVFYAKVRSDFLLDYSRREAVRKFAESFAMLVGLRQPIGIVTSTLP